MRHGSPSPGLALLDDILAYVVVLTASVAHMLASTDS